jgi:hypothetical protein
LNRRQRSLYATVVSDLAVLKRHIEINAHKNSFTRDI